MILINLGWAVRSILDRCWTFFGWAGSSGWAGTGMDIQVWTILNVLWRIWTLIHAESLAVLEGTRNGLNSLTNSECPREVLDIVCGATLDVLERAWTLEIINPQCSPLWSTVQKKLHFSSKLWTFENWNKYYTCISISPWLLRVPSEMNQFLQLPKHQRSTQSPSFRTVIPPFSNNPLVLIQCSLIWKNPASFSSNLSPSFAILRSD
jgi:hypothetical protein